MVIIGLAWMILGILILLQDQLHMSISPGDSYLKAIILVGFATTWLQLNRINKN